MHRKQAEPVGEPEPAGARCRDGAAAAPRRARRIRCGACNLVERRARPAMKSTDPAPARALDRNAFLILLAVLTIALAAIIWPFYGAVFWGAVLALLFEPLYRKLAARLRNRRTLAALVTLSVILVMVILPLTLVAISLVQGADRHVPARQDRPGQLRHLFRADRRRPAVVGQRAARAPRPRRPRRPAGQADRGDQPARRDVRRPRRQLRPGRARSRRRLLHRDVPAVLPAARRRRGRARDPRRDPARSAGQGAPARALHDRDPGDREGQRPGRRRAGRARRPGVLGPRRARADAVGGRDGVPVAAAGGRRGADLGPGRALPARHRPALAGLRPDRLRRLRDRPDRQRAAPDPGRQGHAACPTTWS